MSTTPTENAGNPKRPDATRGKSRDRANSLKKPRMERREAKPAARKKNIGTSRTTKHNRLLDLMSRKDGATVAEMLEATGWQQHSVRGFLSGTVKAKLGYKVLSVKSNGEVRRYRIELPRGQQ